MNIIQLYNIKQEQKLFNFAFADTIALLKNTEENLPKATDEVAAKCAKAGLIINVKITTVMHETPEDINEKILGSRRTAQASMLTKSHDVPEAKTAFLARTCCTHGARKGA